MTTEERLENLERELARAKRRNRWLLTGLGLCLGASVFVWALGRDTPGRYAVATIGTEGAFVLDTRTGQLWARGYSRTVYLGTNDNPRKEVIETR
jgi:hypothetical protein